MAYMGRGLGNSGINNSSNHNNFNSNNNSNQFDKNSFRNGMIFRRYYYIPLDNTYIAFQIIATLIIVIIAIISFFITYKPFVVDPIELVKKNFINSYIITILILLGITLLANHFSKEKYILIRNLAIILLISIIVGMVFLGVKSNLDSTYTREKFEKIYKEDFREQKSENVYLDMTKLKIQDEKEFFLNEWEKAYKVFNIRVLGIYSLNLFLIILLIYQIFKLAKFQDKRSRLDKDDLILYDEEENIKM